MRSGCSIVVPHFGAQRLLHECVRSLQPVPGRRCEVIVVDNGPPRDTGQAVVGSRLPTRVVYLGSNQGFAAAANVGATLAREDMLLVLNNDASLQGDALHTLLDAADSHPGAAAFALRVMDDQDRGQIQSAGLVYHRALYGNRSGASRMDGVLEPQRVFAPCGAAAAYRRKVFHGVGGFDASYFAYFEDVEIGLRLLADGHDTLYLPGCSAVHLGGATSSGMPGLRTRLLTRNAYLTILKSVPLSVIVNNAVPAGRFHAALALQLLAGAGRRDYLAGLGWIALRWPMLLGKRWRRPKLNANGGKRLEATLYDGALELMLPTGAWRYPSQSGLSND